MTTTMMNPVNRIQTAKTTNKTWRYVRSKEGLLKVVGKVCSYLQQPPLLLAGKKPIVPYLAIDCETYRPDRNLTKFPRAVMNGGEWEGKIRLIQLGFEATNQEWEQRDVQYLIDVKEIGEKYVAAALRDEISQTTVVGHNFKYDLGFLIQQLGWEPKNIIDTMTISQVLLSGDRVNHGLIDMYDYFGFRVNRRAPGLFSELTGMSIAEYRLFKKKMQKKYWGDAVTAEMLQYAADDVRLIWYVLQAQEEEILEFRKKYESNFSENKGIEEILSLEFALLPIFTRMEMYGIGFDAEYYRKEVIPLMERKADEALAKCARHKNLRLPTENGENWIVLENYDLEKKDVSTDIGHVKKLCKLVYPKLNFTVDNNKTVGKVTITFRWQGQISYKDLLPIVTNRLSQERGYHFKQINTINIGNHHELLPALHRMGYKKVAEKRGIVLNNVQNATLTMIIDPDDQGNPVYQPLHDILEYLKARDYCNRYGRNLLNHVTKDGKIHVKWNPQGSEHNEVVSGRSSAAEPPIMQMASKKDAWGVSSAELLRKAWIADPDCVFVVADYSNIEPRMIAELSKDEALSAVFLNGEDQHGKTAEGIFNLDHVPIKNCPCGDKECSTRRAIGKFTNLLTFYGGGPVKLAIKTFVESHGEIRPTTQEAGQWIDGFWEQYWGADEYRNKVGKKVTRLLREAGTLAAFKGSIPFGVIQTKTLGRPRRFCALPKHGKMPEFMLAAEYGGPNNYHRYYNEFKRRLADVKRAAFNHMVQGTCADMLKIAELFVFRAIKKKGWDEKRHHIKIVMHDELVVQCAKENEAEMAQLMSRAMMKAALFTMKRIPVEIAIGAGVNWYEGGKPTMVTKSGEKNAA